MADPKALRWEQTTSLEKLEVEDCRLIAHIDKPIAKHKDREAGKDPAPDLASSTASGLRCLS